MIFFVVVVVRFAVLSPKLNFCVEEKSSFWISQNLLLQRKLKLIYFVAVIRNFSVSDCVVFFHGYCLLF